MIHFIKHRTKKFIITAISFASIITLHGISQPAQAQAVAKIPVRDFFKNPEITRFQISPDGKFLSYLKPWESRMNLFIRPANGGDEKRLTSLKDRDLASYFWKGNEHLIFSRDFGGDENFHIFSVNINTGAEKDLTPFDKVRAQIENDLENVSDTDILVSHNKRNAEIFDVYRINVNTGKSILAAQNNGKITEWLSDHKGQIRIAVETDGVNKKVLYRKTTKDNFEPLISTNFKDVFSPVSFTFDNKNLWVLSNIGRDKTVVVEFDLQKNKESKIIASHPENDVGGLVTSRYRKVPIYAGVETWRPENLFLDPEYEKIYNTVVSAIDSKIKNPVLIPSSMTKNEEIYIFRAYSDVSLGGFYQYVKKTNQVTELAKLGTHLPADALVEKKPIQFKSRDGLTINGYLSIPKNIDSKNLPLVVNPHGGPWARDGWYFTPEMQFLSNRGYAVLQVNFRGSTGYGRKFWQASFKQWGRDMQNDITDGVNYLISQKIVNPKKICIYGGSYGGYATLAGLTFTPDLYTCGISYVGVSNLLTFMNTIPPYWKPYLEMLYEMVGHPEKEKAMLVAASPALNADKIKAPLFIAQGAKDPRVVKAESDQMVEALRKRGIEVPYMVKDNEGHGFRNEENRFEFYEAMEKFLAKYL
jgi:dienelactone hydrolase